GPVLGAGAQGRDLGDDLDGVEMHALVSVKDLLAQHTHLLVLAYHDPMRVAAELRDAEAAAAQPEQVALRAGPQREVDQALGRQPQTETTQQPGRPGARRRHPDPARD